MLARNNSSFSLQPQNFEDAMKYAKLIADSSFCPSSMKGKAGDVLIAIQMGNEIGLHPMQAIQNIAVINGRPSLWGDAMIALVRAHPQFEDMNEWKEGDTAYCTIKRRGQESQTRSFSVENAKKAGLLGKAGPWTSYPERMLQMRARGFALRDVFPDALKGLISSEEAYDCIDESTVYVSKKNVKGIEGLKAKLGLQVEENTGEIIEQENTAPSLEDVENMIKNSTCKEDIEVVADVARSFSEEDKEKLKKTYAKKLEELKNKEQQ